MEGTDKETAEVMNCLLSMSKVQTPQISDVQYWQNGENSVREQYVWKFNTDGSMIQHIPIEYKMDKRLTYVVTQNVPVLKSNGDGSGGEVVLIQEIPTADLQFIQNVTTEEEYSHIEVQPSSSKADSSYSESVDVEVEELDVLEDAALTSNAYPTSCDKPKKPSRVIRKGKKKMSDKSKEKKLKNVRKDNGDKVNKKKNIKIKDDEFTKLEDNWQQVAERFELGCECSTNCFEGLNPEKVFRHHLNIADLTKAEHDMYLMGNILASMQNPDETTRKKERLRMRTTYAFYGKRVCLTAFLYLEHVTLYHMKRIRKHLTNHGICSRIHGNHGRKPANTLSLDIYQHATEFVNVFLKQQFSNVESTSSRGVNKNLSYRLSHEWTKKTLHDEYKQFCFDSQPPVKPMQYSTFTNFFNKQFPNVKFRKVDKCEVLSERNRPKKRSAKKAWTNKVLVVKQEEATDPPSLDIESQPVTFIQVPSSGI